MAFFQKTDQGDSQVAIPFGGDGVNVTMEQLLACRQYAHALDLRPHARQLGARHGQYVSRLKGRGMEFSEVRHYQPTDDVRTIDWRVTARTGKPHTKLYQEERERPVFIVTDFTESMSFGSQLMLKSVQACQLAASFAWRAFELGDRVGGVIATQHTSDFAPRARRRGLLPLLKGLADAHHQSLSGQYGSLNDALERLTKWVTTGNVIIVISDFSGFDATQHHRLATLSRHNQLILCRINDPLELHLPDRFNGDIEVSDGHQRHGILHLGQRKARQRYQQQLAAQQQQLDQQLLLLTRNVMHISSGQPLSAQLRSSRRNGR